MSAQVTITQLPSAGALTGTENVPVVQNGVTVQTTTGAIAGAGALNYPFLTTGSTAGLTQARALTAGAGLSLADGGAGTTLQINMTGAAAALNAASTGLLVKTGTTTVANVALSVGSGMTIVNADGVAGNPTISLSTNLQNVSSLSGTGLVTVNGTTFSQITLTGTANQIAVANGTGVSGNPTFSLADNPILPGVASTTLPSGTTSDRPASPVNGMLRYSTSLGLLEGYINGSWQVIAASGLTGVISVGTGTGLTGGPITSTGTISIANTAVSAGSYGSATQVGTFTVNAQGQLTSASNTTIANIPNSSLINSSVTVGTTAIPLGSSSLTLGGLTTVTVTQDPVAALDLATKQYVDAVAQGLDPKASCEAATTANITLSGTQTIDGVALIAGDRCLVKNQTLSQDNGIYLVAAGSWTRATDMNTWAEVPGAFTFIEQGTLYADTGWVCTSNAGGTLGTTPITWAQFAGVGSYTAGTGLTLTGTQFSITNTSVSAAAYGSASSVPTFTVNAQGQLTLAANSAIAINGNQITSGLVAIANGGTNSSATATAGGAGYGTGTAHAYTAAGTAGQVLTSAGASAPTWSGISGGTF